MTGWLRTDEFVPHGFCLSWDSDLIATVVLANCLIALAYSFLCAILVLGALARRPVVPRWIYWSFAAFIFSSGVSHVLDTVTLWYPVYRLQAAALCITAMAALLAAVLPLSVWAAHEMERWRR
jgi:hypothetical protein